MSYTARYQSFYKLNQKGQYQRSYQKRNTSSLETNKQSRSNLGVSKRLSITSKCSKILWQNDKQNNDKDKIKVYYTGRKLTQQQVHHQIISLRQRKSIFPSNTLFQTQTIYSQYKTQTIRPQIKMSKKKQPFVQDKILSIMNREVARPVEQFEIKFIVKQNNENQQQLSKTTILNLNQKETYNFQQKQKPEIEKKQSFNMLNQEDQKQKKSLILQLESNQNLDKNIKSSQISKPSSFDIKSKKTKTRMFKQKLNEYNQQLYQPIKTQVIKGHMTQFDRNQSNLQSFVKDQLCSSFYAQEKDSHMPHKLIIKSSRKTGNRNDLQLYGLTSSQHSLQTSTVNNKQGNIMDSKSMIIEKVSSQLSNPNTLNHDLNQNLSDLNDLHSNPNKLTQPNYNDTRKYSETKQQTRKANPAHQSKQLSPSTLQSYYSQQLKRRQQANEILRSLMNMKMMLKESIEK